MFPVGERIVFWRPIPGVIIVLADGNSSRGVGIGENSKWGEFIISNGRLLAAGVSNILF
jgi:hypothetical protein